MNLPCLFLFCFGLLNSQVSSAPGLSPPGNNDEFADHQDTVSCGELSDTCAGCLTLDVSFYLFSLVFQIFSKKKKKKNRQNVGDDFANHPGIVFCQELSDTYYAAFLITGIPT